ncbi:MAG: HD domain-containing protein [Bdellovibrio sp.]|nr:HD domain-containing protein [Bdellovibrio sp.]
MDSTANYLKQHLYEVEVVNSGKKAQLSLYNHQFFAVVLNLAIKNHSGLEVLKFVRTKHAGQRVMVLVESVEELKKDNLDGEKLRKLGATEVMVKPFTLDQLRDVLEGQQTIDDLVKNIAKPTGPTEEMEVKETDANFTKVKIEEFYTGRAILFDVFIQLGKDKYVKILFAGDTFSIERLNRYKNEKGVQFLYFHNTDRKKYIQYCNYLASKIITSVKVSGQAKVKMMKATAEKLIEEVYSVGLKPQAVEESKQLAQNMYQLIENQPDLYQVLREFQEFDPNAYTHSYSVTLFATAIIKQFEWQSKVMIETTALACLLHDVGKVKMPKELVEKRPATMTQAELEIYKKHPEFADQILSNNLMIGQNVRQIILQHHEYFNGTGFPNGLKGNKVLSISNIISLCDDFVHFMIAEKTSPPETLKRILVDSDLVKRYNSLILENFIKVFVDPGKISKNRALPSNSRLVPNKRAAS